MQDDVRNLLARIDVEGTVIRVPVDYSNTMNGYLKLQQRKELIVELTGILASQIHISGNVSREDSYYYIMYVEGTPDEIKKVRDMIDAIDAP